MGDEANQTFSLLSLPSRQIEEMLEQNKNNMR